MISRGPGFLAVVKVCLPKARPATHRRTEKEIQLSDGKEGGRARGAKLYHRKKAWSSVTHSMRSGCRQMADQ
jgi:hypothetical protein